MLADDAHPAIAHFTPEQRAEIRRDLTGASVRRVGLVMMGTAPASNIVYNAAANLTTAALGGPEALTAAIHARDRAFAGVAARRYMLRDRRERGDNEAPALALAAVYQRLASRRLAGIDAPTLDAIHAALRRADDPALGRHFDKGGSLPSDPMCEVRAGWYDTARGPLVYVVMTRQPMPGADGREASGRRLASTADDLAQAIVQAGCASLTPRPDGRSPIAARCLLLQDADVEAVPPAVGQLALVEPLQPQLADRLLCAGLGRVPAVVVDEEDEDVVEHGVEVGERLALRVEAVLAVVEVEVDRRRT